MFIGHLGLGCGTRWMARQVSLGTLFLACRFADLLWPTLDLAGVEHFKIQPGNTAVTPLDFTYYPWSHSLDALLIWALAFALVYWLDRQRRARQVPVAASS